MSLHLSKTEFCSAVQCPKMLWLNHNMPNKFDQSVIDEVRIQNGREVGEIARGLFGPYFKVPFGDLGGMLSTTTELMAAGTAVIAEASFSYGNCFCSVDILVNKGDKRVELYEVKSSAKFYDMYTYDVAYQYYVLTSLGYEVEKASLVDVSTEYERHGELDLQKLFTVQDLTHEARNLQSEIQDIIDNLNVYMEQTEEPPQAMGLHCFEPHDCGFWKYCTREWPNPNVFDIAKLTRKKKFELINQGILSFEDVELNDAVKENYMKQVKHELHDLPEEIDELEVRMFMQDLYYPLYFLDFESFQPVIPIYDCSKPYEQITFQYSLHYILEEGGELQHKEFLAYPEGDPRRAVAERLCEDIPKDACVTAYNMGFEKGRIRRLAELYPDLGDHLINIMEHIQDLMIPFQKKYYYNRAMQGSYSIKKVLPALFPDDPELDYHNLEEVHNGGEASATFKAMHDMTTDQLEASRKNLLKYCELDTYAMVKIWEKLKEV